MDDWLQHAACRGEDIDIFYPPDVAGFYWANAYTQARAICDGCPVVEPCLEEALAQEQNGMCGVKGRHGFRGGRTPSERYYMQRDRNRALSRT